VDNECIGKYSEHLTHPLLGLVSVSVPYSPQCRLLRTHPRQSPATWALIAVVILVGAASGLFSTGEGVIDGVDVRREPTSYEEDQGLCSGV
jgi:hypothetical protein